MSVPDTDLLELKKTTQFRKDLKRMVKRRLDIDLLDDDLLELQEFILKNPEAGDIIQGTGGLTIIRFTLPNTGKSSGVRVLYVDFIRQEKIIIIPAEDLLIYFKKYSGIPGLLRQCAKHP